MKKNTNGVNRREFLKVTTKFTAATIFIGLGSSKIHGADAENKKKISIPTVTLNNDVRMPILGFGTLSLNGAIGAQCVSEAISVGYRLIDTAHIYGNEASVGEGIKLSGIDRKKLFITSKLWVDSSGYENTKKAFETSIKKLGVDYLDLYLIHRPRGEDVKGSWLAMEELYTAGKIRAIGVSNFDAKQMKELLSYAKIVPAINQIETNVFYQEKDLYPLLKGTATQIEAWSPLVAGRSGIFSNKTLAAIGIKYNKSIAQVCLRWHFQRGIVTIPKSSQKAHMIENLNIFDFELTEADMQTIASMDLNITQFPDYK